MINNYLKIAIRNLRRQKGYSFINIIGLATGLVCCILIFLWIHHELNFDRFHQEADRIYRVIETKKDTSKRVCFPTHPNQDYVTAMNYAETMNRLWANEGITYHVEPVKEAQE